MIQLMRDRPAMLKTALGMKLHTESVKKIRGTEWEKILFPKIIPMADKKLLSDFRAKADEAQKQRDKIAEYISDIEPRFLERLAQTQSRKRDNDGDGSGAA